jgi:hypothetical protein
MATQNTKVITGRVRMSYTNLFTPRAMNEGDEPKYSLSILIPKSDSETLAKIEKAVEEAKKIGIRLWGGKPVESLKLPLRDGDEERPDQEEYAGHFFLNASSRQKPGVIDKNNREITDVTEVYSGCYGRVSINFYPFNVSSNKGVRCELFNVQKLQNGEALTTRTTAQEDFADGVEEDLLW